MQRGPKKSGRQAPATDSSRSDRVSHASEMVLRAIDTALPVCVIRYSLAFPLCGDAIGFGIVPDRVRLRAAHAICGRLSASDVDDAPGPCGLRQIIAALQRRLILRVGMCGLTFHRVQRGRKTDP